MTLELRVLFECEEGATAVEYGLILALIALAVASAVSSLGSDVMDMWDNMSNTATDYMQQGMNNT